MVYDIGKIDLSIYKVVTKNIQTDEVIITDERMKHIQEHHPGDFEKYRKYFSEILQHPDYILQTKKHTAEVLKEIDFTITDGNRPKRIQKCSHHLFAYP